MMRRLSLISALFLTFACASVPHPPSDADLDAVREAVFRHQVKSLPAGNMDDAEIYFISLEGEKDPSDSFLARFEDLPLPVKPLSAAFRDFKDGSLHFDWRDKATGRKGESYRIHSIRVQGTNSVEVEGSYGLAGYVFKVRRIGNRWRVVRETMVSIA